MSILTYVAKPALEIEAYKYIRENGISEQDLIDIEAKLRLIDVNFDFIIEGEGEVVIIDLNNTFYELRDQEYLIFKDGGIKIVSCGMIDCFMDIKQQ